MNTGNRSKQPTIARIWRGCTKPERADEYEAYNYEVGIKPLIEKAMGVQTFREDRTDETEFITISYWENVEAMSAFTSGNPTDIHHLERDEEFLIELPKNVQVQQFPLCLKNPSMLPLLSSPCRPIFSPACSAVSPRPGPPGGFG